MRTIDLARLAIRLALCALAASAGAVVSADTDSAAHSAKHLVSPPSSPATVHPVYYQMPPAPFGQAAAGTNWAVYGRGVNRVNAAVSLGRESWLATDLGVKRIDQSTHTDTHFTRLDGLPDDRVLAVAADGDSAWAVVAASAAASTSPAQHRTASQPASAANGTATMAALCEYHRADNRWVTLRSVSRPIVAGSPQGYGGDPAYATGDPLENSLVAACPEKVCFALSPVRPEERTAALCYDRRLHSWDEIPSPFAQAADRKTLSITWLDVNRDAIWIGTTAGLLTYRLREKTWRTILPGRMVYSAAKAGDGSLWLATYQPPSAPDHTVAAGSGPSIPGRWFATRFTPGTGTIADHEIVLLGTGQPGYGAPRPVTFSGISLVGGAVWLTPGSRGLVGQPVPYCRFDLRDGSWRYYSITAPADMDAVPDVALAQPTLPRSSLQIGYYPWRLSEWTCRDTDATPPRPAARNAQADRDADGTLWSTDGRALLQLDDRGAVVKRFGLVGVSLPVTPLITAVSIVNRTLYAMSGGDVQAYDLDTGVWHRVRLPRGNWSNPADERLIASNGRLLVGTPTVALRYDPGTQQCATESFSVNGGYRLLGSTGDAVWLRGPDNLLYGVDPETGEPQSVDTAPLPTEAAAQFNMAPPFGIAAGLVWYRLMGKQDPERCLIAGYDPKTSKWVVAPEVGQLTAGPASCLEVGTRAYVAVSDGAASVRYYDSASGQWGIAAPKQSVATIISVDDEAVWCLDIAAKALLCYHRKEMNWTTAPVPNTTYVAQTGNEAVRMGSVIYLATSVGVWSYEVPSGRWTQLPGFTNRDTFLSGIFVDPSGVWSIARPGNGGQAFAVHFDKASHRWASWGAQEGFPERAYPDRILPDGRSAWVLAAGVCYRFDPELKRWDNVSIRLARPKEANGGSTGSAPIIVAATVSDSPWLPVAEIVPDGDSVWILPRTLERAGKTAGTPLVVRFDQRSGSYERLSPPAAVAAGLSGHDLQLEHDAVWIPTSRGVFRLAKSDETWRKVDPPPSVRLWDGTETQRIVQRDHTYWFFGEDRAVRWTE